jgi:hypothetical protein
MRQSFESGRNENSTIWGQYFATQQEINAGLFKAALTVSNENLWGIQPTILKEKLIKMLSPFYAVLRSPYSTSHSA